MAQMKLYKVKVAETMEKTVLVWASSMASAEIAVQNGKGDSYLQPGVQRNITEVIEEPFEC